jgi:PAS domain S-box-containing protein
MVAHFRTALEYDREVELVRREDHLRLITDNMLDLIVQIGLDGSLQYVSPAVKDMLGYTPEMLIGEPLAAWVQRLHPDDLQPTRRLFERLAQGKTVKSPYTIELRCKHADGHYVWLEGLGNMLTRREGQTAGFILIVRDITERIKAQETVRQTHQQLEMAYAMQHRLIEQTPVGIQVFDTNGICTDVNQAQLDIFGVSNRDQLIGKFNIFADAMAASVGTQQGLRRALNGETVHLSEVFFDFVHADPRYTARNGQRVLSVSFFPLYNAEGKIVNVVALNQDITARKRAEDQKIELAIERERIKLLQRFIGDLAHDIRTPLATINTSLYLLMRANLPEKRETHQHIIESQVLRLEKVVEDLTNASRLEDEAFAYTFRPALLNQIVEDVANDFHDAVADKRHTLTVQCDREVESILTDRSQLKQALKYILENAINYTPEGGQIYLTTYRKARQVCVEIRDTGMGIEANNLNYIFEPFYRVDKSRGDSGGAGLGLTVARRIVKAHGGEITVESKIGVGSTFCVWLPITINWS